MNEERMDVVLEQAWEDEIPAEVQTGELEVEEGAVGADITEPAQEETLQVAGSAAPGPMTTLNGAPGKAEGFVGERRRAEMSEFSPLGGNEGYKGRVDAEHPLLTRVREQARQREMERFLAAYPEVKAGDIPREVWEQAARGVPLVSAYAMHENRQLKLQLAAERQDRLNRQRTPGGLGSNSGNELDELDRMWNEED